MGIRYRCLLIDHDDTAVDSTSTIHYPAHLEAMAVLRPGRPRVSLEDWFRINFHPGIGEFLTQELRLTERELEEEYGIWRRHTTSRIPPFYPGFLELLADFRRQGGRVAVVSHSDRDVIERHYRHWTGGDGVPELIFGWELDAEKRKPNPWPAREALRLFGLEPREALILDDLKPGVLMSQATGIPAAAAGWAHRIPEIEEYMRRHCRYYCASITELRAFIFHPREGP